MKYKVRILTLLMVGLLVFAFGSYADINMAVTANTNTIATSRVGNTVVLTAFTAEENNTGPNTLTAFWVENTAAGTATATSLASVSIYNDVNEDGELDADDTLVAGATTTATTNYASAGGGGTTGSPLVLTPDSAISFAQGASKAYLVVATFNETKGALDEVAAAGQTFGAVVDGTSSALTVNASTCNAVELNVVASHLEFASYNSQVATGGEIAVTGTYFLKAVDDFGNLDGDFSDTAFLSAIDYVSGDDITGGLTATVNGTSFVTGAAGAAAATIASGKLEADVLGVAGEVDQVIHATAGPVTLVAKTVTSKLEGSVTITNSAYPATTPIVEIGRGIEVYDRDHDGHIDHMTIFFNTPVAAGALDASDFTIGSGYTISSIFGTDFDAGGVGIRNAGKYGVTLVLAEKSDTYDTNVKPNLIYNGAGVANLYSLGDNTKFVAAFGTAQAIEVDKARPILVSAITKDTGLGTGTASNGILDGIVFTFSEPVRNVTAGASVVEAASGYIGLAIPVEFGISFNQGSGTTAANVVTIPVGETTINTGVTPSITYNENWAAARITDYASSATGAANSNTYNSFYSSLAYYGPAIDPTFATTDGANMVVHSVETLDNTADGRLDHIRVTFSEAVSPTLAAGDFVGVQFSSSISTFASGAAADGIYDLLDAAADGTPDDVVVSGSTVTFGIAPVSTSGVFDTESTPSFIYDPAVVGSNVIDSVGNELQEYGPSGLTPPDAVDLAAPVVVKMVTADAFADTTYAGDSAFEGDVPDGRIDSVTLYFSEKVKTSGGAQNGGTALDNAVSQFAITHQLAGTGVRTKIATTATFGDPVWEDVDSNGDNSTKLTISFQEAARAAVGMVNGGDTGMYVTAAYTASGTSGYNIKDYADDPNAFTTIVPTDFTDGIVDGAAPFVVRSVLGETYSHKNLLTVDLDADLINTPSTPIDYTGDFDGKGDGYLEGFKVKFTEDVYFNGTGAALAQFATTAGNGGVLTFNDATAKVLNAAGAAANVIGNRDDEITLTGKRTTQGSPDTGTTPVLTYTKNDDNLKVLDAADNVMAAFTDLPSFDAAKPVIVGVYGDIAAANKINFTFSEPVYAHDADGKNITVAAAAIGGSTLFAYENLSTGVGASAFTSAVVTQPAVNVIQATLNSSLTVADIANDLIWLKTEKVFDDANAEDSALADNAAVSSVSGASIKVWIMDDVVAPWIIGARTIDWNGNGKVDYIRFQLSEAINDASLKGYVSNNAMSNDVSATWKLSGYSGTAMWNLFEYDADGQKAAANAGKPVFKDNQANDAVLYLALDEEAVPANAATGIGSTGFKPTVTWGTGTDAETLGDARPNLLDTASTKDTATNGTVVDAVAPAIVGVTASGTNLTVLFSEPTTVANAIKMEDFWFSTFSSSTNDLQGKIYGAAWTNTSTLELTLKSDFAFTAGTKYGVQLTGNNTWSDAAGRKALSKGTNVTTTGVYGVVNPSGANAETYTAVSPIATNPSAPTEVVVGLVPVSNLTVLADNSSTTGQVVAGTAVTLKWTSSNIDQVELYQSFNNGATYELIPGSQVVASAGTTTWTAKMGVTHVKIQAVGGSAKIVLSYSVVYNGSTVGSSIGAPADLAIYDVPNDNGGFVYAKFTKSADHLTAVNSYQFYREVTVVDSTKAWVLWATVSAGVPDADGKLTVLVPTCWNDESSWKVAASTTKLISEAAVAAKVAGAPVADVVYVAGAAAKVAVENVSSFSAVATGASIDNIAPSALTQVSATDNAGAGTGILVSWTAPADHGVVASYTLNGITNFVYGVDAYEVYRKASGSDAYVLAGSAVSGSTSFTDNVTDGAAVYSYLVKAVDSAHSIETVIPGKAMAGNGTSDFNNDGSVSLSDLVLIGNVWGLTSTSANFVSNFDLNKDGKIDLGDLVLLGNSWTKASKVAKAAGEMPTANVAFQMVPSTNQDKSMYFVSINTQNASDIKGVSFDLNYDAAKFDFVPESVTGLGELQVVKSEEGLISVASLYNSDAFGTITLGFKTKSENSVMDVKMVNAEVAMNDVVSQANNAAGITLKALPTTYALKQNFPNPFNPTTTIEYSIPTTGHVTLAIYNIAGQKIRTLVNDSQSASFYKVVWDGKNDNGMTVGTGTYFYKLVSGNYSKIVKMTLMK